MEPNAVRPPETPAIVADAESGTALAEIDLAPAAVEKIRRVTPPGKRRRPATSLNRRARRALGLFVPAWVLDRQGIAVSDDVVEALYR